MNQKYLSSIYNKIQKGSILKHFNYLTDTIINKIDIKLHKKYSLYWSRVVFIKDKLRFNLKIKFFNSSSSIFLNCVNKFISYFSYDSFVIE